MSQTEEITLDKLQALGVETLAQLVMEGCNFDSLFAQRVKRTLVAATRDTKSLISLLKQQLTSLSKGKKFYEASESEELAEKLREIRRGISDELAPLDLKAAIELMQKLLSLHSQVFERVDDSYGNIWPIFDYVLENLAALYIRLDSYDRRALAQEVFNWYSHNGYGIYDNVIKHFAPALGEEGQNVVENLLKNQLTIAERTRSASELSTHETISGLLALADARQNVEEYMSIIQTYCAPITCSEQLAIAERLVQVKRDQEALQWLEQVEDAGRFEERKGTLKIRALEGLGRNSEAQQVRIQQFSDLLSTELYQECLKMAAEPESLQQQLLNAATAHGSPSQALYFFYEIGEWERAAQLVRHNRDKWNGRDYYSLQPVAKKLEKPWPFESTILYRALIDDIVARAQSKYYHHAVRYMKALEQLSLEVEDWNGMLSHEEYLSQLRGNHKRKTALWSRYDKKG